MNISEDIDLNVHVPLQLIIRLFSNNTLHCKVKYAINLELDPTLSDAGDSILLPIFHNHEHWKVPWK